MISSTSFENETKLKILSEIHPPLNVGSFKKRFFFVYMMKTFKPNHNQRKDFLINIYLLAFLRSSVSSLDSLCLASEVCTTLSRVSKRFSIRCRSKSSVLLWLIFPWLELDTELTCSCRWWTWVRSMVSIARLSCSVSSRPVKVFLRLVNTAIYSRLKLVKYVYHWILFCVKAKGPSFTGPSQFSI